MTDPTNVHEPVPQSAKLTAREKKWIIYDVGNSAFVLLSTAVIPIYAKSLMPADGNIVSAWGYAQTIASLVIALLMPLLGSIADVQGMKIKFFLGFFGTGVVTCCAMALPLTWLPFLVVYILATIGLNGSLTFYDSMLIDTTSNERMDKVSSHGYGWGYIGSTVPFIACIALIFGGPALFGWSTAACTRASFIITAIWWVAFTIPLLTSYRQVHYRATRDQLGSAMRGTFSELAGTFGKIVKNKPLWMFMIAFFFYIDAVNTVISMSTSYGAELGIDSTQLVVALLVTQFVAFPCSIAFGRFSAKYDTGLLIKICILCYTGITLFAVFLVSQWQFWVLAVLVGMFQGGIQALSRSYLGKIIPAERSGEYFGLMDICGKGASFLGTTLIAVVSQLTDGQSFHVFGLELQNENIAVGTLVVIFAIGFVLFCKVDKLNNTIS